MRRPRLAAFVCALALGGCSAETRIERMQLELANDLAAGRNSEAALLEGRIGSLAGERFGESAPDTFMARAEIAKTYGCWLHTAHAVELATATLRDMEARYGSTDEHLTIALAALVRAYACARQWHDAQRAADRIVQICRNKPSRTDMMGPCRRSTGFDINILLAELGDYRESVNEFFILNASHNDPGDRRGGISMLSVIGHRYAEAGEYPEALWYLQRCVDESRARYERTVAPHERLWTDAEGDVEIVSVDRAHSFQSQSPRCLEDLIALRRNTGDHAEADRLAAWQRDLWARGPDLEAELTKQVRFADAAWHDDRFTSGYANDLAFYYTGKGRTSDAIRAYQDAIRWMDRGAGPDQRRGRCDDAWLLIDELLGLGAACEAADRAADAEAAYRRAARIAATELNPHHSWRLEPVARLARVLSSEGRSGEAEATWRHYLALTEQQRGPDHADYAIGLAGLADTLATSGRSTDAKAARARADGIWTAYARRIISAADLPLPTSLLSPSSPAN